MHSNGAVADQSLVYLANRLANRKTYLQYGQEVMGPIHDNAGVEQGGICSGDEFQLITNAETDALNNSGLGVDMGHSGLSIAAITAADDEVVLSNTPHALQSLLNLASNFCRYLCMKMVKSKTHLMLFNPKIEDEVKY